MKSGIATFPLDYGRCPKWLFERMKKLARSITMAVVEEFGAREFLRRLSDPVWFQSFGCVLAFDWNSSGLTTTTMAALKEGLRGLENDLKIFICGGKGKTSRRTPEQIQSWGEFLNWSQQKIDQLVYVSKISAKVDNSLLQDGFQIYHHNLIFTNSGEWSVLQQGMAPEIQKARRYHWLSQRINNLIEEPHSGIASEIKVKPLNLTAKKSDKNREISVSQVKEEPKTFLKNLKIIQEKISFSSQQSFFLETNLVKKRKVGKFTEMKLKDIEFHWHPVLKERFDLKRLKKIIEKAHFFKPENFEELLSVEGVGPKTIRALSLVSEIIYGAKPSFEDPARYSFAHGGKDFTPYPVDRKTFNKTIEILEKGIQKSKISLKEKLEAQRRLNSFYKK